MLALLLLPLLALADPGSMRMSDVRDLVLRKGEFTEGRRSLMPQLRCMSGPCEYAPDVVRCQANGVDYVTGDPLWTCTGNLAEGLAFGRTDVVCEGAAHADDPMITRGSCGLEYVLLGTPMAPPVLTMPAYSIVLSFYLYAMVGLGAVVVLWCVLAAMEPNPRRQRVSFPQAMPVATPHYATVTPWRPPQHVIVEDMIPVRRPDPPQAAPCQSAPVATTESVGHGVTVRRLDPPQEDPCQPAPVATTESVGHGVTVRRPDPPQEEHRPAPTAPPAVAHIKKASTGHGKSRRR